jgi:predicted  nucleic acid-binding Zn-ribbon protein
LKRSIQSHKDSLKSMREHIEREWKRIESLKAPTLRLEAECLVLEKQIAEAERRGMAGFDDQRFMRLRKS